MSSIHCFIAHLKHWQAFGLSAGFTLLVGYALHLLEEYWYGGEFAFRDSDMPGIPLYIAWGLWLDTVAVVSRQGPKRWLAPTFLTAMEAFPHFLYYLPGGFATVAFAVAIAFIFMVVVPTAKALQAVNKESTVQLPLFLEAVILILFPFCLFLFQPRLNRALAKEQVQG